LVGLNDRPDCPFGLLSEQAIRAARGEVVGDHAQDEWPVDLGEGLA
jgi:hypothetical protein